MSSQFLDIPIYRKALEIRMLSASISHYLRDDLAELNEDGSEDQDIYVSGDIIQQSSALAPEILNAEKNRFHSDKKYVHLRSLSKLTKLLYRSSKRLELANSNGSDYLKMLQKEIQSFNSLRRKWVLTL